MSRFARACKGSIAIFLIMIMLPMFVCAGLVVDGARASAARTLLSDAGDMAINAALSEYEQVLKDVYGLFAVSDPKNLSQNVERYFLNTLEGSAVLEGTDSYTRQFMNQFFSNLNEFETQDWTFDNIVDAQSKSFNLTYVQDSALSSPRVLEAQIIEFMKYRAPIELGKGILSKIKAFGDTKAQVDAVNKQLTYNEELNNLQDACKAAYKAIIKHIGPKPPDNHPLYDEYCDDSDFRASYLGAPELDDTPLYATVVWRCMELVSSHLRMYFTWKDKIDAATSVDSSIKSSYVSTLSGLDDLRKFSKVLGDATIKNESVKTKSDSLATMYSGLPASGTEDARLGKEVSYVVEVEKALKSDDVKYAIMLNSIVDEYAQKARTRYNNRNIADTTSDAWTSRKNQIVQDAIEAFPLPTPEVPEPTVRAKNNVVCNSSSKLAEENIKYESNENINGLNGVNAKVSQLQKSDLTAQVNNAKKLISGDSSVPVAYDIVVRVGGAVENILGWNRRATAYMGSARATLAAYHKQLKLAESSLKDAIEKTKAISVEALKAAKDGWRNSVQSGLQDGDVKTNMQAQIDNAPDDNLSIADRDRLVELMNDDLKVIQDVISKIEGIKYFDKQLYKTVSSSAESQFGAIKDHTGSTAAEIMTKSGITNSIEKVAKPASVNNGQALPSTKSILPNTKDDSEYAQLKGVSFANFVPIPVPEKVNPDETGKLKFWTFLVRICTPKDPPADAPSKETAKADKKSTLERGNKDIPSDSAPTEGTPAISADLVDWKKLLESVQADALMENSTLVDDEDAKDVSGAKNSLNSFGGIFGDLGSILSGAMETLRDNLYVEEYITGMFSNAVDVKEPDRPTLTRIPLNKTNNTYFGAEQEYILFGLGTAGKNVAATQGMIFGIRFALNCIFAFTNSEIRAMTNLAALAIAGWTGFGVPIVQAVLTLALALAESGIDLKELVDGKDVVVYKTAGTWTMSLSGAAKALASAAGEEAIKIGGKAINNVFGKIDEFAQGKITDISGDIKGYIDDTIAGIYESVKDAVMMPVLSLESNIVSTGQMTADEIKGKLIDNLNNSKSNGASPVDKAKNAAIDFVKGQCDALASQISNNLASQISNNKVTAISDMVSSKLDGMKDDISGIIKGYVDDAASELTAATAEATSKGKDFAQEKLTSAVESFNNKITGQIDDKLGQFGSVPSGKSNSIAAAITLNYQEYIKLFLLMGMIGKKDNFLVRTALLIGENAKSDFVIPDKAKPINGNTKFDIQEAYTMVQATATITVRTTFLDILSPVEVVTAEGNTYRELDYSKIGTGRMSMKYNGVMGY